MKLKAQAVSHIVTHLGSTEGWSSTKTKVGDGASLCGLNFSFLLSCPFLHASLLGNFLPGFMSSSCLEANVFFYWVYMYSPPSQYAMPLPLQQWYWDFFLLVWSIWIQVHIKCSTHLGMEFSSPKEMGMVSLRLQLGVGYTVKSFGLGVLAIKWLWNI